MAAVVVAIMNQVVYAPYLPNNTTIISIQINEDNRMSKTTIQLTFEKETKNSVRFQEVPEEGKAPVVGTVYLQKWFAGQSKNIELTIEKKD